MLKQVFSGILVVLISSCGAVLQDNVTHYDKMTRDQGIKKQSYSKNTVEGMRFLVANKPDKVLNLNGSDFDHRYNKLIKYLKDNSFTIVVNEKFSMIATIIAEVNKPMPNMKYIGIAMEQNTRTEQTRYSVVYSSNKFLAHKLYEGYKKSLVGSKKNIKPFS
jgi:hypothetical protein